jgi:hypothetical protein
MAKPSQADLDKKKDFKESLIKSIGGDKLSDKKMCTILRSCVRKTWMMSPVRLLKLENARIADMDPTTRTNWLCRCEQCKGLFKMTDVEVDHIKGEHQLKALSDIEKFSRSILDVTLDELQIFCKPCHEAKTYAERYGITFSEAVTEKKVILWLKANNTIAQKKLLVQYSFTEIQISNADKRKECYRAVLNSGQ